MRNVLSVLMGMLLYVGLAIALPDVDVWRRLVLMLTIVAWTSYVEATSDSR